jgi:hypothetical protein
MGKDKAIEIFLRIRPTKKSSKKVSVEEESEQINFTGLKAFDVHQYVNNTKDNYMFNFNKILPP